MTFSFMSLKMLLK